MTVQYFRNEINGTPLFLRLSTDLDGLYQGRLMTATETLVDFAQHRHSGRAPEVADLLQEAVTSEMTWWGARRSVGGARFFGRAVTLAADTAHFLDQDRLGVGTRRLGSELGWEPATEESIDAEINRSFPWSGGAVVTP